LADKSFAWCNLKGFLVAALAAANLAAQEPAKPAPQTGDVKPASAGGGIAAVDPNSFVLGVEDVIFIRTWRNDDWTWETAIRPDGKITGPLIGDIEAAGKTPAQVAQTIAELLTKYINKPEVTVTVRQVNSKKYYVTGEVNQGGAFPLVGKVTVLEALGKAGGFREFANLKKIVILRNGQRLPFNYRDVTKGKKLEQNIVLEPGDYIIVP
jgi:polysaccharide export outer membrane protein